MHVLRWLLPGLLALATLGIDLPSTFDSGQPTCGAVQAKRHHHRRRRHKRRRHHRR
jgi:hypothetical protein